MKFSLLTLALIQPVMALNIRDYVAATHDRFLDFPAAPSKNPNFIYANTDLSGVGWYIAPTNTALERRRQLTMVSPRHFVGANHFRTSPNGSLSFVDAAGVVQTFEIESIEIIPGSDGAASDLFLGTLEADIPSDLGIQFQPFLSVPTSQYEGQELIFMGHRTGGDPTLRAGRGLFQTRTQFGNGATVGDGIGINFTEVFTWTFQESSFFGATTPDDAHVEGGDSGSPSLVSVNGQGAIVGVHTGLATGGGVGFRQFRSFDAFVPFYVEGLNEAMAVEGYHMTRAVPGPNQPSTTLTASINFPAVIRAGHSVILPVTLTNTGTSEDANNISFEQSLPVATAVSASGELWVSADGGDAVTARKGGLSRNESSVLNVEFTPLTAGTFTSVLTFSADEFAQVTEEVNVEVIESYLSVTTDLSDPDQSADADDDGVPNLLEYAFGGDLNVASLTQLGSDERLLPRVEEGSGGVTFSYLQRTDAEARALSYEVQSSPSLTEDSWVLATGGTGAGSPTAVSEGFERVTVEFDTSLEQRFFRLKVSLNE